MVSKNPYQSSSGSQTRGDARFTAQWAGFGARLLAYMIDILSITLATGAVFYFFLGFDETVQRYFSERGDINARIEFLTQRNQIRDLSFIIYIVYCALTECSAMQATIGKRLFGLRVTDNNGNGLSIGRSFGRNFAKIVSCIPLGLGFIWAIWSKRKRSWHDMIAKTLVIKT
ncbi:MAG: RDD family protein [Planctomycetota bacterium]